jgi:hypothetical protein
MTRDDIIRMAREAGLIKDDSTAARLLPGTGLYPELNVFASLVAEHARNRTWTQDHWTEYERSIAAAERKRCIEACEASYHWPSGPKGWLKYAVEAIQAMGDK